MTSEQKDLIDKLLKATTPAAQKAALKHAAEYLEESHILDLPTSAGVVDALEAFSKSKQSDAVAKTKAKSLVQKYRL